MKEQTKEGNRYDSEADTLIHINEVAQNLLTAAEELAHRSQRHDASKLQSPEKELFDEWAPKLAEVEFGSEEYKAHLEALKPALDHHYANNSHHPQYYGRGVNGMNLFDVIEMFCDWAAAVKRTKNGDILKSIEINEKRFDISPQLSDIFRNTVGWYNKEQSAQASVATAAQSSNES